MSQTRKVYTTGVPTCFRSNVLPDASLLLAPKSVRRTRRSSRDPLPSRFVTPRVVPTTLVPLPTVRVVIEVIDEKRLVCDTRPVTYLPKIFTVVNWECLRGSSPYPPNKDINTFISSTFQSHLFDSLHTRRLERWEYDGRRLELTTYLYPSTNEV